MPSHPMTHHEILDLVEPFTRAGRRVDLAASDRVGRRVLFKPRTTAATIPTSGRGDLQETLQLENPDPGRYVLTRIVGTAEGAEARLETQGADPAVLLQRIDSIDPQRQFRFGPGFSIALDYSVEDSPAPILTRAVLEIFALKLTLKAATVSRMAADFEIVNASPQPITLPEDLLAVLGRPWSRLNRMAHGWRGNLYVPGGEPERSRRVEAQMERAAAHLAASFAASPGEYHDRWVRRRWGVYFRRATPLLVCLAIVAAAAAVPKLHLADDSGWRMLIFNAPPLLMVLVFCLRELPSIEIPPWPRRSRASAWREVPTAAGGARGGELQLD